MEGARGPRVRRVIWVLLSLLVFGKLHGADLEWEAPKCDEAFGVVVIVKVTSCEGCK